jgi:hypothetical protein
MHWFFCLHEFVFKKIATLLICSSNSIHIFSLSFKESKKIKNDISSFSLKSLKDLFLFKHASIVLKMNKDLSFQEVLDFLFHT